MEAGGAQVSLKDSHPGVILLRLAGSEKKAQA